MTKRDIKNIKETKRMTIMFGHSNIFITLSLSLSLSLNYYISLTLTDVYLWSFCKIARET